MTEEKKEKWLNYLALATVILAVCATLSTFKGGGFSTRSVLAQTHASDLWSFYQAKSIKMYIYDIQKEKFELELKEKRAKLPLPLVLEYENKIQDYAQKIKKYAEEKTVIEKDAKEQERIRDESKKHAQEFGMAVIFLQIAILLSSVAALLKKKPVWIVGLLSGIVGIFYFVNGFIMFLK